MENGKQEYYISSTGDTHRHKIYAASLRGAKRSATNYYSEAIDGEIYVEIDSDGDVFCVAVKCGYDKWTDVK